MSDKINRPICPELENIIGVKYPILDHGWVQVVDYMGVEQSVVDAARISYSGGGTVKLNDDKNLLRYLWDNQHSSPFEMLEIRFNIAMPIFVMRQWVRHRTACLAGDNVLNFSLPKRNKHHPKTVEETYKIFKQLKMQKACRTAEKDENVDLVDENVRYKATDLARLLNLKPAILQQRCSKYGLKSEKVAGIFYVWGKDYLDWKSVERQMPIHNKMRQMRLRSLNEYSLTLQHTNIVDIWESGVKKIYLVKLPNGNSVKCSEDHLIHTNKGWLKLNEFYNIVEGTWNTDIKLSNFKPILGESLILEGEFNKDAPTEVWKKMIGFEDRYEISSLGRVKSHYLGKVMDKKIFVSQGRHTVRLSTKGKGAQAMGVYRLLAENFIPNPDNLPLVCHRDGNSLNDNLDNLYWGTYADNTQDSLAHDTFNKLRHDFSEIESITALGEEMTYDLEVEGPHHNFSCNGIVVHNSTNEISGRYSVLPRMFYTPEVGQMKVQSKANKQGGDELILDPVKRKAIRQIFESSQQEAYEQYEILLEDLNLTRELSRCVLPVNLYTQITSKWDIRNLLHFLRLRLDPHAQYEIRVYAERIHQMLKLWIPNIIENFDNYTINSFNLSGNALEALKGVMKDQDVAAFKENLALKGVGTRESDTIISKLFEV